MNRAIKEHSMSIKYDHENLQFHERELNEFDKKD